MQLKLCEVTLSMGHANEAIEANWNLYDFLSSELLSSLNFGQVADIHFVLP